MKKIFVFMAVSIFVLVISNNPGSGASFCKQEFELLAVGNDVIFIREDVTGECLSSDLLVLNTAGEQCSAGRIGLKKFGQWKKVREAFGEFARREAVELVEKDGTFTCKQLELGIKDPAERPSLMAMFEQHVKEGGSGGRSFNSEVGKFTLPVSTGRALRKVYMYPAGLYINYTIDRAYYLPGSGRIIVFTKQARTAVGMDTMHGFMILGVQDPAQGKQQ